MVPATDVFRYFYRTWLSGFDIYTSQKIIYYSKYHSFLICELLKGTVIFDTNKVAITLIYMVVMYPLVIFPLLKKDNFIFHKGII